jgi:hypothetical protein
MYNILSIGRASVFVMPCLHCKWNQQMTTCPTQEQNTDLKRQLNILGTQAIRKVRKEY